MKIILSHPTGNANVRAAAVGLANAGLLYEFYTTIAAYPGDLAYRLGEVGPLSEIRRRSFDPILQNLTRKWPWTEVARLLATKLKFQILIKHETGMFSIDAVYRNQDTRIASRLKKIKGGPNGVYCYEDGALLTFRQARQNGLQCFYDLPIGYWRSAQQILEVEKNKWPEWASTLIGLENSTEKLLRKDQELLLADKIFVASSFTAKTLNEFQGSLAPIKIVPYGFPEVDENRLYEPIVNRPLKLLFVGGLSQRKGIANLFEAVQKLSKYIDLTVIGKKPKTDCPALNKALLKHRWISGLSHAAILQHMRSSDVLIFPSLFEGFGLVVTESMSQGTPVITTERTCGIDLICNNENGWLVEAGSTNLLFKKLEECITRPQDIPEVGWQAMKTAKKRPWSAYGYELANAIMSH